MPDDLLRYLLSRTPYDLGRDALDVFITYYIFYRIALVLRGTRAIQVVFGLALVFLLYLVAQLLKLDTVLTLLSAVLSSAILIGVVVFQNDIRRGLMRVGARARFGTTHSLEGRVVDQVVEAATTLARHRTGAIITFEQEANLDEFVGSNTGHVVDAAVSADLLVSLFVPEAMNTLHDGSVIIRDLRIAKAGVFFPMPQGRVTDESFGSRHRAAMGITEETDAVVVVVSEERGSISFCFNGNIVPNLDGPRLKTALEGIFVARRPTRRTPEGTFWARWRRKPVTVKTSGPTAASPTLESAAPRPSQPPSVTAPAPHVTLVKADETPKPLRKKKKAAAGDAGSKLEADKDKVEPKPVKPEQPAAAPKSTPEPLRKRRPQAEAGEGLRPSAPPPSLRGAELQEAQLLALSNRDALSAERISAMDSSLSRPMAASGAAEADPKSSRPTRPPGAPAAPTPAPEAPSPPDAPSSPEAPAARPALSDPDQSPTDVSAAPARELPRAMPRGDETAALPKGGDS